MRRHRPRVVLATLLLAACFGSSPPLPPVRWFDPLPPAASLPAAPGPRVTAAPHLGREFAVRVGERELAFDSQHQWIAEPRELVQAALAGIAGLADVHVAAFELDVTGPPCAHVRLLVRWQGGAVRVVEARVAAADRSPPAFAAAAAAALAEVAGRTAGT